MRGVGVGFWDVILRRDPYPVEVFTPRVEYLGTNEEIRDYYATGGASLIGATPAALWRQQPHLRTHFQRQAGGFFQGFFGGGAAVKGNQDFFVHEGPLAKMGK